MTVFVRSQRGKMHRGKFGQTKFPRNVLIGGKLEKALCAWCGKKIDQKHPPDRYDVYLHKPCAVEVRAWIAADPSSDVNRKPQ